MRGQLAQVDGMGGERVVTGHGIGLGGGGENEGRCRTPAGVLARLFPKVAVKRIGAARECGPLMMEAERLNAPWLRTGLRRHPYSLFCTGARPRAAVLPAAGV